MVCTQTDDEKYAINSKYWALKEVEEKKRRQEEEEREKQRVIAQKQEDERQVMMKKIADRANDASHNGQYRRIPYDQIPANRTTKDIDLVASSNARLRDAFPVLPRMVGFPPSAQGPAIPRRFRLGVSEASAAGGRALSRRRILATSHNDRAARRRS